MSDDSSRLALNADAPPSQALIVRPRTLPTTAQFAIETQLAWKLRNARGFLPNHFMVGDENERAAKILAAIEYARAVGIEPMIALQNTQVIDGKVGASALLIGALLRKAGYTIADDTNDERSIVTVSKNGTSARGEFSMQDADRAQLVKPNSGWQKYPRDMMYARALTQAARRGAQDAVLGMAYTAEELGGIEEEIAGVPALEAQVSTMEPGASEAGSLPAAIQPTPPAPSVEVPATPKDEPVAGQAEGQTPLSVATPPQTAAAQEGARGMEGTPPQAAPSAAFSANPLAGPSVSRRMGRSIGPQPKRTNVTSAPAPATADEQTRQSPVPDGPGEPALAPSALTDEPLPTEPVDEGERVYAESLRQDLRLRAAVLAHLNAIVKNHLVHPLKNEPLEVVPPATPSDLSDNGLQLLIDRDFPGRTLDTLGPAELQNRLELIEPFITKRREQLAEKGISSEE